MQSFDFVDAMTGEHWKFEMIRPDKVRIQLPKQKVDYTTTIDFDPKVEFEGNQSLWIEWAAEELLDAGEVVFDEDEGLVTPDALDEINDERLWARQHVRQESDPWRFLH